MSVESTTHQGLTHMCDDADCHVPGFVTTLRRMEQDSLAALTAARDALTRRLAEAWRHARVRGDMYEDERAGRGEAEAERDALREQVARVEADRDHWQDKWKRRGQVIEDLKAERDRYRRESAEHLALLDGKTAINIARAALHPTDGAS